MWINLNGEWEFGAGAEPRFDRRILVPFAPQAELCGIGERNSGDRLWYRRRFAAPEGARLLLHLGAVDHRTEVLVNGARVARHEGGHTPFAADLAGIAGGKRSWTEQNETTFYMPTAGIWADGLARTAARSAHPPPPRPARSGWRHG